MAVGLKFVDAWTHQVGESSAHLAAFAELPANAHLAFVIFLDGEVALEVAVAANGSTFESSSGTLTVSFGAEGFFSRTTSHVCCFVDLLVSVADGATDVRVGRSRDGIKLSGRESRTDMEVFVEDQVIEVMSLAKVGGDLWGVEFLGCKNLSEMK